MCQRVVRKALGDQLMWAGFFPFLFWLVPTFFELQNDPLFLRPWLIGGVVVWCFAMLSVIAAIVLRGVTLLTVCFALIYLSVALAIVLPALGK